MNPINQTTQVVIVGAGPTGLSLAAQLLRYNIDFIILEKNGHTTPLSKALVVHARSLEILLELGLAEKAIALGSITSTAHVFYKGKQKVLINISALGKGLSSFPFTLSLEQSKTEKLLVDHLIENGKTIYWNSKFEYFEQTEDGVRVNYSNSTAEYIIDAKYIVGCDGAKSQVRHQMGLSLVGDTLPKVFYVTDVKLSSPVINKDQLFIILIKKGFILFFPMQGAGHYRVIGILPDKSEEDEEFIFEQVEGFIKEQIILPIDFEEVHWFSTYKVHTRKSNSFLKGRCIIAGDAAHIHTPAGGQGMNTGIQDAYNLAWKLAFSLKYDVIDSVLTSYDSERVKNAEHLLKTTDRVFDMMAGVTRISNFMRLTIIPIIAGFLSKSPFFNKRIFPLISQIGIAYPESSLSIKGTIGKVKAGSRMTFFEFSNGSNIFNYITEPGFKILFFGIAGNNRLMETGNMPFKVVTCSFTEIPRHIFGSSTNFYILLRPDNHISYIGKDANKCFSFLKNLVPNKI